MGWIVPYAWCFPKRDCWTACLPGPALLEMHIALAMEGCALVNLSGVANCKSAVNIDSDWNAVGCGWPNTTWCCWLSVCQLKITSQSFLDLIFLLLYSDGKGLLHLPLRQAGRLPKHVVAVLARKERSRSTEQCSSGKPKSVWLWDFALIFSPFIFLGAVEVVYHSRLR